jgi:hypothetical protein
MSTLWENPGEDVNWPMYQCSSNAEKGGHEQLVFGNEWDILASTTIDSSLASSSHSGGYDSAL